jgi:uridine kinase
LFALSIFVECDQDERARRRMARDMVERGRSAVSVEQQLRRVVAPMHARYVAPQARWADLAVTSPVSSGELDRLAERILGWRHPEWADELKRPMLMASEANTPAVGWLSGR